LRDNCKCSSLLSAVSSKIISSDIPSSNFDGVTISSLSLSSVVPSIAFAIVASGDKLGAASA
jgi:hypothetical protein